MTDHQFFARPLGLIGDVVHNWLPEELEQTSCPSCESVHSTKVGNRPDKLSIFQCSDCGLAFVNPQPTLVALKRYYANSYFEGAADFYAKDNYFEARSRSLVDGSLTGQEFVTPLIEPGKTTVLEIGSSDGALLLWLKNKGAARVQGIELDRKASEYCLNERKIPVFNGELQEFKGDAPFDLVLAMDLFEHVKSLKIFFKACYKNLNIGGRIIGLTPNFGAFKRWGMEWAGIHSNPEHLLYLDAESLKKASEAVGMRVEKIIYRGMPLKLKQYRHLSNTRGQRLLFNPDVVFHNSVQKMRTCFARSESKAEMLFILRKNQ